MTDKQTPTDAELKAMWQLHAADIGGIFCYARAVLAKWGTLRADKIVIPANTMEQEFQQHYRRGYEAGKKASTHQPTQMQPVAREPLTDEQIKTLMQAHRTAMLMTCKARVPECGGFAAIAQDLDWLCESFGIKGDRHVE